MRPQTTLAGPETSALTPWRRAYGWKPGTRQHIKRLHWRRIRRMVRMMAAKGVWQ